MVVTVEQSVVYPEIYHLKYNELSLQINEDGVRDFCRAFMNTGIGKDMLQAYNAKRKDRNKDRIMALRSYLVNNLDGDDLNRALALLEKVNERD